MANRISTKTTYDLKRVIQPFHTGGNVALEHEGKVLATSVGEEVVLSGLLDGEEFARLEGDGEAITTLSLAPDCSYLITCSRSQFMRIYSLRRDPDRDSRIFTDLIRTLKPHSAPVVSCVVDKTGTLLATGGADGVVKVWDIRGGYTTHTFHGHSGIVSALQFFEVNRADVGEASMAKGITKRKLNHGKDFLNLQPEISERSVTYFLASGAEDGKIRVWNLQNNRISFTLDSHVSVVRSIEYCREKHILVSGSRDKTVIIWDVKNWKPRRTIPILENVERAGFLEEGNILFTGGENGCIRLWNPVTSEEITEPQEAGTETDAILDIIHYPNLPYALSVHADQTLRIHLLSSLKKHGLEVKQQPLQVVCRISGTHDEVIDIAFVGSDRKLLALATNTEDIRIISLAERGSDRVSKGELGADYFGANVTHLQGHEDIIICLDVDWSGHWLVTGAKDNTARLWCLDSTAGSYSCYGIFTGHAESLGAVALPHGSPAVDSTARRNPSEHPPSFVITGSQDKTVKRWDITNIQKSSKKASRAAYTRKAHDRDINALDTSGDVSSHLFASASQDRTVKIWDTETGNTIGVLRGHRRGVWTVKFAPSNTSIPGTGASANKGLIATGAGDKMVKVWSLADYSCLLTLEGHTNSVLKLLWLPVRPVDARDRRGPQIASAGGDGLVKIWDTAAGEAACTLDNHTDRVWALAVDPASAALISGGGDGVLSFWADGTSAAADAATRADTRRVDLEQKLANLEHAGNFREAITLALQMDRPARLLALLRGVVESDNPPDPGSHTGSAEIDAVLASLADEQVLRLLQRCRDWNTNARTAHVAQRVLHALVKSYPAERLASLRAARWKGGSEEEDATPGARSGVAGDGQLKDVLGALMAYTERHYRHVEELIDQSYLLDFTLREMDEMLGDAAVGGHQLADGVTGGARQEDVLMLD